MPLGLSPSKCESSPKTCWLPWAARCGLGAMLAHYGWSFRHVSREHVPSGWPAIFLGALIAIPVGRALQPWAHQMLARAVSAIHCVSTMKSVSFPVSSLMP